jgi:regulator of sigma E protease
MEHLFSILIAILGLGVLVFIHELGHYFMARREGMRIEVFSIGFGPPIFSWTRDGVRWQLAWIPFGGYVKIAGMQKEGNREPFEIPGGFFNKTPMQRIRVAFMGPLVNLTFAFLVFALLWMAGGREKRFAEYTHRIGWVDPRSELYERGVRAGDLIDTYQGKRFEGLKDLLVASVMREKELRITGSKIDPFTGAKKAFDYTMPPHERMALLTPASYCIFHDAVPQSSLRASGIQPGDRILWADGETIFSQQQLSALINASTVFLTVQRGEEVLQVKVPRVHLDELRLSAIQRAEFDDWQHEAELKGLLDNLYFIPYLLSPTGQVEVRLSFLEAPRMNWTQLEEGDQIIAVDSKAVDSSYEILQQLQTRHVLLIVQRDPALSRSEDWKHADQVFDSWADREALQTLISGIGNGLRQVGRLHLLSPVEPRPISYFATNTEGRQELETIADVRKRQEALKRWEKEQSRLVLGGVFADRLLHYNPGPFQQCGDVLVEVIRVLKSLVTGQLHPKNLAGPVGIVHIVQSSWFQGGVKEGLFWMAFISLNLGLVNLLPIPVLDGGYIVFSLYEAVTKRRLTSKMMERMIIPFFGLLIVFFIYITYQDILRLFSRLFG